MYRLRFKVNTSYEGDGVGGLSKRFHAFILRSIQQESPALSQHLHDRKERQAFSTRLMPQKGEVWVNTPDPNVVSCLQRQLRAGAEMDLIDWKGVIVGHRCQTFSPARISETFSPGFTLHFLTPTTFYQRGNYYPLPELKRLFSSAAKAYQLCTGKETEWGELESLIRKIRVEYLSVLTQRVSFGKFNLVGFKGKMAMSMKALEKEEQHWIWQLMAYGALMGFGYKTAWGLGQTLLKPLEEKQELFGVSSKE
ncbi:CRISPR system precrRNA processing endoribonuclease RAMP protein Cas6 [Thermoactinomyces intermedius]|jgi:CRISPR-associated endoribonuclease Cas6|uniref:CRISPR system precrRNA processing endoribonuclease RAMP protein Cas6 n=1 Tax=Thermoactinomyces intermedius TaxID=2024 RepID=A0A8I1AD93_THEIN|nr:CRISPR system precrRNA processing endoribonuclease RAMP protein Cas6 [Thermoactinomyces intermedius]MBA4547826.1 CRISPR system precrRNA processing endoribonuclease RAMP protein Cas6 [Thermoactinomyces intermedius]MBA4836563.1 CRISPR system precrRNA processing endoribonuclease RAMP protein Cas6 [Thermoactinomyces intermedius]MBH8593943.1 CRISPR system precrRNA processing endoribonuclease RAMP protein Cas6 [Thermoactinomyces intermedius]